MCTQSSKDRLFVQSFEVVGKVRDLTIPDKALISHFYTLILLSHLSISVNLGHLQIFLKLKHIPFSPFGVFCDFSHHG